MKAGGKVFVLADAILSPLGKGTDRNFDAVASGESAIKPYEGLFGLSGTFHAGLIEDRLLETSGEGVADAKSSRLEKMLREVISSVFEQSDISADAPDLLLMVASAKGNIASLGSEDPSAVAMEHLSLAQTASRVAKISGFVHEPVVVSHACISGLLALIQASALIQAGQYKHVLVAAADETNGFVLSGFQSLQALASGPCKPFDAERNGINLGEASAAMLLSCQSILDGRAGAIHSPVIQVCSGAVTNDANHISGPSRTGEELSKAMTRSMAAAGITPNQVDVVSLHGTATVYNDEMEAKAIAFAGLDQVPVNSLKGNYGHTLGAAGLLEAVLLTESLRRDTILPTLGFNVPGISTPLHIFTSPVRKPLQFAMKTASGFGGCNAAAIFSKSTHDEFFQQG